MSDSRRYHRVRSARGFMLAPALLGALLWASSSGCLHAGSAPEGPPVPASQDFRVQGEFGLAVFLAGDSVEVRWLTGLPEEGFLEVLQGDAVIHSFRTDLWSSHRVRFPTPAATEILLRYGSAEEGGERFETRIRLDTGATQAQVRVSGVDSLWVVGDIHGEFDTFVAVLRNAGLVDEELRWSAGTAHFVAVGDMMSRGMDVAAVLWLLYRLEQEAAAVGGRVHVLLGNHEIMVMLADLRYVHPKERWIAESYEIPYDRLYSPRNSLLGRWLASRPAILQVDDVLLAHGGVSSAYRGYTPESHRDSLTAFMGEEVFNRWADSTYVPSIPQATLNRIWDFFWTSTSIFWYRGYSTSATQGDELEAVLGSYDAALHVVGHTPVPGIREAYDGQLIMTNTNPFAEEFLLLVRDAGAPGGWARFRVGRAGAPMPLIEGHPG